MTSEQLYEALGQLDDAYIQAAHQTVRQRRCRTWMPVAACLAVVLTAGVWWYGNLYSGSLEGGSGAIAGQAGGEVPDADGCLPGAPAEDNCKTAVVCNDARFVPITMNQICLDAADFVPLSGEELLAFDQAVQPIENLFPELSRVPAQEPPGVYRQDQGRGEIYFDANTVLYTDQTETRRVELTLSQVSLTIPAQLELVHADSLAATEVNGRQLYVFREGNSLFTSWMDGQTGWQLLTSGLSEGDLSALLTQLVTPGDGADLQTREGKLTVIDPQARLVAVQSEDGSVLSVLLPEEVELGSLRLGDRVRVSWHGEPATIPMVWAQQVEEFSVVKE